MSEPKPLPAILPEGITCSQGTHHCSHSDYVFHRDGEYVGWLELLSTGSFDVEGFKDEPELLGVALDYCRRKVGIGPCVDVIAPGSPTSTSERWFVNCKWPDEESETHHIYGIASDREDAIKDALKDVDKIIERMQILRSQLVAHLGTDTEIARIREK